ncbi:MAG: hypothetical protein AAB110_01160 [Candidatus Desantisbacteria bacterium]
MHAIYWVKFTAIHNIWCVVIADVTFRNSLSMFKFLVPIGCCQCVVRERCTKSKQNAAKQQRHGAWGFNPMNWYTSIFALKGRGKREKGRERVKKGGKNAD